MIKKMKNKIKEILNIFLDIIFPRKCIVCKDIIAFNIKKKGLCDNCIKIFKQPKGHICEKCGREIKEKYILENNKNYCDICKKVSKINRFYYTKNFPVFIYNDATKLSIFDLKYNSKFSVLIGFERLLELYLSNNNLPDIDIIIPAPMHRKKQRKRGFNQATLIAKIVSNITKIKFDDKILIRNKNTSIQSNKNIKQRYENLEDCFDMLKPDYIKNKTILIVDDIYTSGSTINTCAKKLIENGAKEVFGLTMSITEEKNDEKK